MNLRQANFVIGFNGGDFSTTAKEFNAPTGSSKEIQERLEQQKDRIRKNRVPHFDYGHDKVDYNSISKKSMVAHDLSQNIGAAQERKQNGLELRRSHFLFGTDQSPHKKSDIMGTQAHVSQNFNRLKSALPYSKQTNI